MFLPELKFVIHFVFLTILCNTICLRVSMIFFSFSSMQNRFLKGPLLPDTDIRTILKLYEKTSLCINTILVSAVVQTFDSNFGCCVNILFGHSDSKFNLIGVTNFGQISAISKTILWSQQLLNRETLKTYSLREKTITNSRCNDFTPIK